MYLDSFVERFLVKGSMNKWLACVGLFALSGCSTMDAQKPAQNSLISSQPPAPFVTVGDQTSLKTSELSAQLMYQVLAAEVMVAKGYPGDAYDLIYPLALKTRNVELVKRAFELSMATYDEDNIGRAAQLWLEVEPANPTPWRASYLMSLRAGKVEQAIDQWKHYRTLSTASLEEDVLSAAQRAARAAGAEVVMPFFEQVVKTYPDVWQVYYGYGFLAAHYEQSDKAVPMLKKALALLPKKEREQTEPQIYQLLSQVYLKLNSPLPGLLELNSYLKRHPDDWLVQERVARLEVKAEKFTQAESRYKTILKANPEATTSRLSLALLQIEMEKFSDARKNLEHVAVQPGYDSVGYYYLGVLSQEQENLDEAMAFYGLVKQEPYSIDAKLHQAEIVFASKGLNDALAVLDQIDSESVEAKVKVLRAKGIFYRASQMFEKSVAEYSQAIDLDPNNIELLLAQSVMLYDLKRFDEYEANLKRVIELDPNEVDALNALGYFYVEQGIKMKDAEKLLNKAFKLAPDSYYVLDSIGWLAYQQKKYQEAEAYLRKALSIKLDDVVLMHLVATLWQAGQTEQATQLWAKYKDQFINNSEYQTLIDRLKSGEVIR
ncbi:tetratricopeptide repeat protein [Thiomicrorhabdus sp.]|uniref:tetratricopeptide repeat protein n=1 Tax=Thiomicrorhabdus sp. TaxID=2039724 RepID=UPI00356223ED